MRVLHVFKTYLPDYFNGIERVIWQIAEGTHPLGVESTVLFLSTQQSGPARVAHHATYAARRDIYIASTGFSVSAFQAFARLAREHDVIHYHFPWPMMDLLDLSIRHGKPRVVTYHSDIVRQKYLARIYSPIMHGFLGRTDRLIATSPNYLASSPVLSRYAEKTEIIPIGIDEAPPPAPSLLDEWRNRVGTRFFLFVGALRYYKGLPYLIEAARRTGLPVVVAGRGEMSQDLATAGVQNVTTVGDVSEADKLALMELATVFVFPSHLRSEAFGVALLEAARAGKAMISCEIGTGTSYINLDGVTGRTVPPADVDALSQAMSDLWATPERTQAMGLAARQRYLHLFTADAMGIAHNRLYRGLLD